MLVGMCFIFLSMSSLDTSKACILIFINLESDFSNVRFNILCRGADPIYLRNTIKGKIFHYFSISETDVHRLKKIVRGLIWILIQFVK